VRIDILTALPGIVNEPLGQGIFVRATKKELVDIRVHDLRDYTTDKHRQVDDYPFGGESGMVLKPEPIFTCIEALQGNVHSKDSRVDEIIYLTPDGELFNQAIANEISLKKWICILAGHYKGIDQRVRDNLVTREISIGDYVLSGGELPALILVDAVIRLLPDVLGNATSALSDSFQDGLLDAPVYTRPAEYRGMDVPEVLRSGDHERVAAWREAQRIKKTKERRPDLMK